MHDALDRAVFGFRRNIVFRVMHKGVSGVVGRLHDAERSGDRVVIGAVRVMRVS